MNELPLGSGKSHSINDTALTDENLTVIGDTIFIVDAQVGHTCLALGLAATEAVVVTEYLVEVRITKGGLWVPIPVTFDPAELDSFTVFSAGLKDAEGEVGGEVTQAAMGVVELAGIQAVRFLTAHKKKTGIPDPMVTVLRHFEINAQSFEHH